MARPRIFISSTFYDLKHVRYDLEDFIRSLGYEPIMNDRGNIPYSSDRSLERNCYDEVSRCDILVGIIGNKYGTSSKNDDEKSVSMEEIETAIRENKQVFIFVDKAVLNEYQLYLKNKDKKDIEYVAVSDIKIHKFIEEVYMLPMNNAMIPFESATDITSYLKEQFAGLFQRLLQDRASITERSTSASINEILVELKGIVHTAQEKSESFFSVFDGTVLAYSVPIKVLRKKLHLTNLSFFVSNKQSLCELFKCMCFTDDSDPFDDNLIFEREYDGIKTRVIISEKLFDQNDKIRNLILPTQAEEYITVEEDELMDEDSQLPF